MSGRAVLLVATWLLVSCAPAAASVEVSVVDTDTPGVQRLVVRAEGPAMNIAYIRYDDPSYTVTSEASPLIVGSGCTVADLQAATCMGAIASVELEGADGTDVLDAAGVPVTVNGDGGPGDDALTGGNAADVLTGGDGVDQLTGGAGDDLLNGAGDDDWLIGNDGQDILYGEGGDDILQAGTGDRELLAGGSGLDLLEGGSGSDSMQGGKGADVLVGGTGSDTLAPGTGEDTIIGLRAQDQLDCPSDVIDGKITPQPCAEITRPHASAPTVWPPMEAEATASAASDRPWAKPVIIGHAGSVQVHVPAKHWRWVRRCIRLSSHGIALEPPYVSERFKSKYAPKVDDPPPLPSATRARLTSVRHCH